MGKKIEQLTELPKCKWEGASGGTLCDCFKLAEQVFGEVGPDSGLVALAYMWRRFGPPWIGSDGHKKLAEWTNEEQTRLAVRNAVGKQPTFCIRLHADAAAFGADFQADN